jgi:hypothetical protein
MGTKGYGDDASMYKIVQQKVLCSVTTSAILGFRVCGMKIWKPQTRSYIDYNATWGALLSQVRMVDALREFFTGTTFRRPVLEQILAHLKSLQTWFSNQHEFRFYSSSILLIYEGDEGHPNPLPPIIRMVDFAHTYPMNDPNALDDSYLVGLNNLVRRFL